MNTRPVDRWFDAYGESHRNLTNEIKVLTSGEVGVVVGFEAVGNSPSEFAAYVRSQADTLGKVIRSAGIKPQ